MVRWKIVAVVVLVFAVLLFFSSMLGNVILGEKEKVDSESFAIGDVGLNKVEEVNFDDVQNSGG